MIGNLFCPLAAPNDGWLAISTAFEKGGEDPKQVGWLELESIQSHLEMPMSFGFSKPLIARCFITLTNSCTFTG